MIRMIPLLLGILALAACAAPADMNQMTVTANAGADIEEPREPTLINGIQIGTITGGNETNPLWTSEVGSEEFSGALSASLQSHRMLAADNPRYQLNARLLGVEQPMIGFDMTVTSHVNYELVDAETMDPVMQESITTPYTATVGDAFIAVQRLKIANEGSIRENIKEFLERLYLYQADTNPEVDAVTTPIS